MERPPDGGDGPEPGVVFEATHDPAGVAILDTIERNRFRLSTAEEPVLSTTAVDAFRFPIDRAVSLRTDGFEFPFLVPVVVRNSDGRMLAEVDSQTQCSLEESVYEIEICAPVKIYLRVHSTVTVGALNDEGWIDFGEPTEVTVGARSDHRGPAATVTTTTEPRDVMAAVSTFGSALKTTSPERSFPTLRGHPPALDVGDEVDVPADLSPPATDVELVVPPRFDAIYPVAPLAFYLGAELTPGYPARLVLDDTEHPLVSEGDGVGESPFHDSMTAETIEATAATLLEHTFLLDCLTRTEGLYPVELAERRAFERQRQDPVDFEALYEASLAERLRAYLSIPAALTEPLVPDWPLTAQLTPEADSLTSLPYLVDDLATIGCSTGQTVSAEELATGAAHGLVRGGVESTEEFVSVEPVTDAVQVAWVGDGVAIGATNACREAFEHRIDRTPTTGRIDATVVCNEAAMEAELDDVVADAYGTRSEFPFDVTVRRNVTTQELAALLGTDTDFLHFVGHIDDEGVRCPDGHLDLRTVDPVGVEAFFLNACRSYTHGRALVEHGAIGGIVTLGEVVNLGAVRIGSTIARLLDCGFPLGAAVELARPESVVGIEYTVLGDSTLTIARTESDTPHVLGVDRVGSRDLFDVEFDTYTTADAGIGGLFVPFVEGNDTYYLTSGPIGEFDVDRDQLDRLLSIEQTPVRVDETLDWSDRITPEDV
jgi:hypothetical protein